MACISLVVSLCVVIFANHMMSFAEGQRYQDATREHAATARNSGMFSKGLSTQDTPNGCLCHNYTCTCCEHMHVPFVHLDETGCVIVSYLPISLGLRLEVTLNGKQVFKEEVSVRNPPPLCFGVPYLKKYASMCVVFYNLSWRSHIGGCIKVEVKFLGLLHKYFNIGCFHFNNVDSLSKIIVSHLLFHIDQMQQQNATGIVAQQAWPTSRHAFK